MYNSAGVRSTVAMLGLATNQGHRQPPQGCPPSTGLRRRADKVRGRSSSAVSAGVVDTAFVEAAKELLSQDMQKPSHGVGEKRFLGKFSAAPAVVVKIPAGLRTKPAW